MNTIFRATYNATQEITKTFDMVWALDAGLWHLRSDINSFLDKNPSATNADLKSALLNGMDIHGLNFKRIAKSLSWEYEEQYIAELLLLNGIALFDTWIDEFVDATILTTPKRFRSTIKDNMKLGNFSLFDSAITVQPISTLSTCFKVSYQRQDCYINNLISVYKYFKSCRNCCAHGTRRFTKSAENNYNLISSLTELDLGIKEFPKIAVTRKGQPLKIYLRGVVEFYDIIIRIIQHYDIVASEHTALETELISKFSTLPKTPIILKKDIRKRNRTMRNYLIAVGMPPLIRTRASDVFNFLKENKLVKVSL